MPEPHRCIQRLSGEKWAILSVCRLPITTSARPARIGSTRRGMSEPGYWLSASVLTMMSAPRRSDASIPAMNAAERPRFFGKRTTWCTPSSAAFACVPSVLPSSITSTSIASTPSMRRGRSARVGPRWSRSLKQGIWMISFTPWPRGLQGADLTTSRRGARRATPASDARQSVSRYADTFSMSVSDSDAVFPCAGVEHAWNRSAIVVAHPS